MFTIITYELDGKLYINLTNRCSNHCVFCVRDKPDSFDYNLWLENEPSAEEVIREIGTADKYDEIIFCGFGEPTMRLDELLTVARYIKTLNKKVRLNTNGQADLVWGRPTAASMSGLIDSVSISLNAGDRTKYQERCLSEYGEAAFDAVINYARDCVRYVPEVTLSIVGDLPEEELKRCKAIAEEIGAKFRVRTLI